VSTPPDLAELEPSAVEDAALAEQGDRVLDWTRLNMPLLRGLRDRFTAERPLEGRRIGMCLHVEPNLVFRDKRIVIVKAKVIPFLFDIGAQPGAVHQPHADLAALCEFFEIG